MYLFTHAHSSDARGFYTCNAIYVPETYEGCWPVTPHKHILSIKIGLSLFLETGLNNKHVFNELRHKRSGRVSLYHRVGW